MKVVLGLGNPGRTYERTRHNVGWWVLDHLADVWRFDGWKRDGQAMTASGSIGGTRVRLVKPQTFMNLSGAVLATYSRRAFWAAATDLLVVVDEVALPLGRFRLRARGSAGGHNGLKSVQAALGNQEYARLRIGIQPADEDRDVGELSDFVLSPFARHEREQVMQLMPVFAEVAECWVREGVVVAMNKFNRIGDGLVGG